MVKERGLGVAHAERTVATVVKHSCLIKDTNHIPRIMKEAFYLASTGRPGTVLIDVPKDVSSALFDPDFVEEMDPATGWSIRTMSPPSNAPPPSFPRPVGRSCWSATAR